MLKLIIYQTKIGIEDAKIPSRYEIQKIALKRGLLRTQRELDAFKRLEAGVQGENTFLEILKTFGCDHWVVLRNTWFNLFGDFECDFILITRHCIYVFEIKNYFGKFVYQNGECMSRDVVISHNPIQQARRATLNLRNIINRYSKSVKVKGALVFIGPNNQVHILDEVDNLDILTSNDLYVYIEQIKEEENNYPYSSIDVNNIIRHFETYEVHNPFPAVPYTDEELKKARTGICCAQCQSFNLKKEGEYITCDCGLEEPREEAIVRTICEYGALTFDRHFTSSQIMDFIDYKASYAYLRKILTKHFDQILRGRYTYYLNKKLPYERIYHLFEITKKIFIHTSKRMTKVLHHS